MGVGLGHSLLAYKSALQGIAKLQVRNVIAFYYLQSFCKSTGFQINSFEVREFCKVGSDKLLEDNAHKKAIKCWICSNFSCIYLPNLLYSSFFFFMTMGVRTSLHAPRLISRGPKVYSRIFTSVTLKELELVTIREQTQGLSTELPFRVVV